MRLLGYLLINGLAVFIAGYLLPGINIDSIWTALLVAIVLGVINMFIRPILVLLTLPITVLTLGLFILILNGLLVILVSNIVPGFTVDNIWWAMLFSLVLSLVSYFLNSLTGNEEA
jgi:putative membrane protein